jgi:hypothetical protein
MRVLSEAEKKRIRKKYGRNLLSYLIIANVEAFGDENKDLEKEIETAYNYLKED